MTPSASAVARSTTPSTVSVTTMSAAQTRAFGAALASVARPGDRLALIGPLGAGKTQLAKGFALGLGIDQVVNSPSFTLMAEYRGRLPLFHQDLYRLSGAAEAIESGLMDDRQDAGVTITEWGDRLDAAIDADRLELRFTVLAEEERRIELVTSDPLRYAAHLALGSGWEADRSTA
jgi:tRNA threonylcarbamoyladenosine biosynthesis protein TsaE